MATAVAPLAIGVFTAALVVAATGASYLFWEPVVTTDQVERLGKADRVITAFAELPHLVATVRVSKTASTSSLSSASSSSPSPTPSSTSTPSSSPTPTSPSTSSSSSSSSPDRDVCHRYGGHRVDFTRHRHQSWRCVYPRRG